MRLSGGNDKTSEKSFYCRAPPPQSTIAHGDGGRDCDEGQQYKGSGVFCTRSGKHRERKNDHQSCCSRADFDTLVVEVGHNSLGGHGATVSYHGPTGHDLADFTPNGCRLCSNSGYV